LLARAAARNRLEPPHLLGLIEPRIDLGENYAEGVADGADRSLLGHRIASPPNDTAHLPGPLSDNALRKAYLPPSFAAAHT